MLQQNININLCLSKTIYLYLTSTTYLTEVRFVTEQVVLNSDDLALPVNVFELVSYKSKQK